MQVVIDIPEETYKKICGYSLHHIDFCYTEDVALLAIKNGKPLPKGHGRLVDVEDIKRNHKKWLGYIDDDMISRMNYAVENHIPILLKADKEVDDEMVQK